MLDTPFSENDSDYFCISRDNPNTIRLSDREILTCKLYDAMSVVALTYQIIPVYGRRVATCIIKCLSLHKNILVILMFLLKKQMCTFL